MNLIKAYWRKICEPLDGFLWHRDISHPIIRPLLRNQILAAASGLLAGAALYAVFPWFFWFACGMACMGWIFWSWARFFMRVPLNEYGSALLRAVFMHFGLRLLLFAVLLYVALAIFAAPAGAIVAGMIAAGALGLASYAWQLGVNP